MLTKADIDGMRQTLSAGVQVVVAPQLFETPRDLAQRVADLALEPENYYTKDGRTYNANAMRILEPSAGTGMLIGAMGASWYPAGVLVAVEINGELSRRLKTEFPLTQVICDDFLQVTPDGYLFDRIVMNPPFINGADIKHIIHALTFLKPTGRLVAICANGSRQQAKLKPLAENSGGFWEELPPGTFKAKGTHVQTALLVIEGEDQ